MPRQRNADVRGEIVSINGTEYYRIRNHARMDPFFTTVMSSSNLWLYASSTGALAAGRTRPDNSLFPYDSVDRIHAAAGRRGPYTAVRVTGEDGAEVWRPFAPHYSQDYTVERHVAKHLLGTRLLFEEVNSTLDLAFRYEWQPARQYGWVRRATIRNISGQPLTLQVADGLIDLLSAEIPRSIQQTRSVLADAYRKNEILDPSLGIFSLASGVTDRPQASEVLRANVVWQHGLPDPTILLSRQQLPTFLENGGAEPESQVCGQKGAYLGVSRLDLPADGEHTWYTVADAHRSQADVTALQRDLSEGGIMERVHADVERGEDELKQLLQSADASQSTGDNVFTRHHTTNVLFNCARGGVPVNNYRFPRTDFARFLQDRNAEVYERHESGLEELPEELDLHALDEWAEETDDADLQRLATEYLPLAFSRRHGDPSRPWNQFAIRTRNEDGSWNFAFQGNWRDIFQNWEALGRSFPELLERFIAVFVNASTIDGFNPYRITRDGIDWEVLDPDDPWSSIGYWGDHQIIYLLKLLRHSRKHHPDRLASWLDREMFCFGHVPYRIKSYDELCRDPFNSVVFDQEAEDANLERAERIGGDGKLFHQEGRPYRVNLAEKLLIPVLCKLSNIVPGGGLWLNTGRPEWNDANNALAGNGLSVVTLCHLRPHLEFLADLFEDAQQEEVDLSREVVQWFNRVAKSVAECPATEGESVSPQQRKTYLDAVGQAFSDYRQTVYDSGFSGKEPVAIGELTDFFREASALITASIRANRRADGLFHAYNLVRFSEDGREIHVEHLYEMLEGQVSALDSELLDPEETVELLDSLRNSELYRLDQNSYRLYPERHVPDFLEKNVIPAGAEQKLVLVKKMLDRNDDRLVQRDAEGKLRFNPDMHNADVLRERLDEFGDEEAYAGIVSDEYDGILDLYEEVFGHARFTGRSGGMFAYEGVGCIYWHLVGKLLLAANNAFFRARRQGAKLEELIELKERYYNIRGGLGFNKSPRVWGAFPIDAYSHTPRSGGASQPGMTGQVKEEILARWGELGVRVEDGQVHFDPALLRTEEFLDAADETMEYRDVDQKRQSLELPPNSLAFTYCQVPIIYQLAEEPTIRVELADGDSVTCNGMVLGSEHSQAIFNRTGQVRCVRVNSLLITDFKL